MRPFVTETNQLYLFGGRNSKNATNYIQIIDLNQVFMANENCILNTYDRMELMQNNKIIPFVDFPTLKNETCIMISQINYRHWSFGLMLIFPIWLLLYLIKLFH